MAARKSTEDVCMVTVGYTRLLMPATDGLKVVALLRNAREVEIDWNRADGEKYIAGERPRCELSMVAAKDLRAKAENPEPRGKRKPLLLGHDG